MKRSVFLIDEAGDVLRKLGLPSIAGFIIAGVIVGPSSLGLVADVHEVELLAELGVVG